MYVNTDNVQGKYVLSSAGGNATDGHVLTADGSGGADWEASAGGGGGGVVQELSGHISQAEFNAMGPVGSAKLLLSGVIGKIIVPIRAMFLVERNLTQATTHDLYISWDASTATNARHGLFRRFMWNETGDRTLSMAMGYLENWQTANPVGESLTLNTTGPLTTDAIADCQYLIHYSLWEPS